MKKLSFPVSIFASALVAFNGSALADNCHSLSANGINYTTLKTALQMVVPAPTGVVAPTNPNGGLSFPMWLTLVDGSGLVCAVVNSLNDTKNNADATADIWLGSRAISAQKANTANDYSTGLLSLSTANLYSAVQPGGSLFGLQHSNPVYPKVVYGGKASDYGTVHDPMVGKRPGGVNVFGGGLTLYLNGKKVGAIGVSGDTSCTDHVVAYKVRAAIKADVVPPFGNFDKMFQDITNGVSASGFGHPTCLNNPIASNDGGSIVH